MNISYIINNSTESELLEAVKHTANNLHVPESDVSTTVAVGYVRRHFHMGALEGWEGFIEYIR